MFGRVEQFTTGFTDPERKRLFTQRLFNRLMFIAFIQKKGWLKFDSQTDYLSALWEAYQSERSRGSNFYNSRLKNLFFLGLNTQNEVNIIGINRGGFLGTVIGEVPYLSPLFRPTRRMRQALERAIESSPRRKSWDEEGQGIPPSPGGATEKWRIHSPICKRM